MAPRSKDSGGRPTGGGGFDLERLKASAAGKRVLVGVTGGIAAYKTATVVSKLAQAGAQVTVAMTEAATHFVTALTFQGAVGECGLHQFVGAHREQGPAAYFAGERDGPGSGGSVHDGLSGEAGDGAGG